MCDARLACLAIWLLALGACKSSPGATCVDEGSAKCDGSNMLVCKGHKWEAVTCGGPKGCVMSGRFVDCDETFATAGMPCGVDPASHWSCSVDKKTRLKCDAGFWHVDIACRGPRGCVSGRYIDCDDSIGQVGEACEADALACSLDSKSVLACRSGKFIIDETCTFGRCTSSDNGVGCE